MNPQRRSTGPGNLGPTHTATTTASLHHRLWQFSFGDRVDNASLARFILRHRARHPEGKPSALNCWQSRWDLHRHARVLDPLIRRIEHAANSAFGFPRRLDGSRIFVTECWAAVYERGESASMHDHGKIHYSGVYYVSTTGRHRSLTFEDGFSVEPATGRFVMFDGGYRHRVPRSISTEPRIIVAVNMLRIPGHFVPRPRATRSRSG